MKLSKIVTELKLESLTTFNSEAEVSGAYASDLLSDVIANAEENEIWVTLQGHENIVAVAILKDLAAVIVTGDYMPNDTTITKAQEKEIALFSSKLTSYQVCGKLYQLLQQR